MQRSQKAFLAGLGIGLGLMYLLDPNRGRRRRATIREQITHRGHAVANTVAATGRDLAHRAAGAAARVRHVVHPTPADDVVLVERVRARLGRLVSNPHSIKVQADTGVVTLRGPILQSEVQQLVSGVSRVGGVRDVVNALDAYAEAGNIPALQTASAHVE